MNLTLSRAAVLRAVGFFLLWIMLSGGDPADLAVGAMAALAATWASPSLLAPDASRVRPAALDPKLPLRPGFVLHTVGLPPGAARNMFTTLMSLLPGTVPTGSDERGRILIHCLDVEQPVAAQLAAAEALFVRVVGEARGDG